MMGHAVGAGKRIVALCCSSCWRESAIAIYLPTI